MLRRLIILLLIVVGFAHEEMDALEKQMLYKQNNKSPLLAGLCAFTPTVGHIYVGKWNKRLLTPALPLGVASLPFFGLAEYSSNKASDFVDNDGDDSDTDWDKWETWGDRGDFFQIMGWITLAIWYPLQLQDAIYLAYQHNADLYEEIYGKEYIRPPKKSIIQKLIDKKEAKKNN